MEALIEAVNQALEAGDWSHVVTLTQQLYDVALSAGEPQFAELVQDLHWNANDALVHPLEVGGLVQS
jgi:DNA-binding GntR family transcriptional regulator